MVLRPRDILELLLVASMTTIEAIKRVHLNARPPGQQPRPSLLTIAQRTPRWRLNKDHGGRKPNFSTSAIGQTARELSDRPKMTEDTVKTSLAASASLLHARRFRAPSAHPSDPESDSPIDSVRRLKKTRMAAARTRRRTSLLSSILSSEFVSWALCHVLRYSDYLND